MNEGKTPTRDRNQKAPRRTDRIALLIVGATLAITPIIGTTALAGSGGVGSGGGGSKGSGKYARLWDGISEKNKRWAKRTSRCESGGNERIHGGGGSYHGAFQFMKSTWKNSPKSPGGDPHTYNWRTQAVVAVYLKRRDGAGHWPNCG
jgi:Transglycosylase-like domain